jgi:hemolysin activation/secretion protein
LPYTEKLLSTQGLHQATDALTAAYHDAGVFAAKVFIPPQTINDGIVMLYVYEGILDKDGIVLKNSGERVRNSVIEPIINRNLQVGEVILTADIERSILLLEDMPGIHSDVTLYPGEEVGTAKLKYEIRDEKLVTGNIDFDNFGGYYTGKNRLGGTVYVNSPTTSGDQLTLRLVTSGQDSNYGFLRYSIPVLDNGTRVGFSTDYLDYNLGKEYAALGSEGNAFEFRGFINHPHVRSRHTNLNWGIDLVHLRLDDHDDFGDLAKRTINSGILRISGDHDDDIFAAGTTYYSVDLTFGNLDIEGNQAYIDFDQQNTKTEGGFSRLYAAVSRLQYLGGKFSTFISFSGQLASKNLDSSQKFYLGGPFSLPGYPTGQVSGDDGALLHLDLRRDFYTQPWGGLFQASIFYAYGWTRLFKDTWPGWEGVNPIITNEVTLQSIGVGFNQNWTQGIVLRGMVGWQVGEDNTSDPVTGNAIDQSDEDYRGWLQGIYYF